jgi:hypothetical protein
MSSTINTSSFVVRAKEAIVAHTKTVPGADAEEEEFETWGKEFLRRKVRSKKS